MENNENDHSAYRKASSDGAVMGLAFCFLFAIMAYGMKFNAPAMQLLSTFGIIVCVPALLFYLMRRQYLAADCRQSFAAVWMHGATTMVCGNLILGLFIYVFIRFIEPGFVQMMFDQAADSVALYRSSSSPVNSSLADALEQSMRNYPQPSPIGFALSSMYSGSFWGLIVSLVLGLLIKASRINNKK